MYSFIPRRKYKAIVLPNAFYLDGRKKDTTAQ